MDGKTELFRILAALLITGAFGGVVAMLNVVQVRDVLKQGRAAYGNLKRIVWCIGMGAIWGAGAAMASAIILATDDKFDGLSSTEAKVKVKAEILICATGVVAGFAGIGLLKRLSSKLGDDVKRLQDEMEETKEEIAEEKEQTTEFSTAIGWATLALSKPQKGRDKSFLSVATPAIAKLEKAHENFPHDRTVAVFLGRLYRWKDDLPNAIRVLEETVEAQKKLRGKNASASVDEAVMLYNLACYRNLECRSAAEDKKAGLRVQAVAALNQATSICPEFLDDARTDSDLEDIV